MADGISSINGWILICRGEDAHEQRTGDWHIAWSDIFGTKKSALEFAKTNKWPPPYRAVRGRLMVRP